MNDHTRRAVACIAAAVRKGKAGSVYDYAASRYFTFSASVEGGQVSAYDYEQHCHISGTLPSLYHYGNRNHLTLNVKPDGNLEGYDYASGNHFSGKVDASGSVSVYDHEQRRYFSYSA